MSCLLRHRELQHKTPIVRILLRTGYQLTHTDILLATPTGPLVPGYQLTPPSVLEGEELCELFALERQRVASLTHLCRLTVRRCVVVSCHGNCFLRQLQQLPLPPLLIDFVAFSKEFSLEAVS